MLVVVTFWLLVGATLFCPGGWLAYRQKSVQEWVLDGTGLAVQGTLIPLLQAFGVAALLRALAPEWAGSLSFGRWDFTLGWLLNVLVVDYLYYWNHRLMHHPLLWRLHRVHHSVESMDVVGTSRNTLWTSLLFVYLWCNGAALYLLENSGGYMLGAACTAALDLWRHSRIGPTPSGRVARALSRWVVLPCDHAWHHAASGPQGNFAANFRLWDRLHGTAIGERAAPERLGQPVVGTSLQKLLWPPA